jgi:hypothetical protein
MMWIMLAASLLPAPSQPVVLDAETRADIRCYAVQLAADPKTPQQVQDIATVASYFMGRIDGRMPNLDLGAALQQEANEESHMQMSQAAYAKLRDACLDRYGRSINKYKSAVGSVKG